MGSKGREKSKARYHAKQQNTVYLPAYRSVLARLAPIPVFYLSYNYVYIQLTNIEIVLIANLYINSQQLLYL